MNDTALLEDALRAYLNRRCRRAYAHDLRNGLQGVFGGVDALIRTARSTKPIAIPLEQLTQFVRQAIANHERGLERVLENMAPENLTVGPVAIRELLLDLIRFLTNDAARNNVRIRLDIHDNFVIQAAVERLRLIAVGLLVETIDALPTGGEIRVTGQAIDGGVQVTIVDSRTQQRPVSFAMDAIEQLVAQLSGRIAHQAIPTGGYQVKVDLPFS